MYISLLQVHKIYWADVSDVGFHRWIPTRDDRSCFTCHDSLLFLGSQGPNRSTMIHTYICIYIYAHILLSNPKFLGMWERDIYIIIYILQSNLGNVCLCRRRDLWLVFNIYNLTVEFLVMPESYLVVQRDTRPNLAIGEVL